ncbi:Uridine phosphorylase 2 [Nymphon striatum]|nr:Uridine phosphorylase 2 [Nymphon striatum]
MPAFFEGDIFFDNTTAQTSDVMDAARDVMGAVRDVIPVACEALPSKMLLLLWLRSIPCFNTTAATREALLSRLEILANTKWKYIFRKVHPLEIVKDIVNLNSDGSLALRNPHIEEMPEDFLYHLSLGTNTHDLKAMFSDIKFVVMGGTPKRMEAFAHFILDELKITLPPGTGLIDISKYSYRYSMYKVGPVLSVSHGMGIPSLSIMLHEIIKLMYYAECKDVQFFRMGTCGGIGIEAGNLVISESAVDGLMRPYLEMPVLGKLVRRPAVLDLNLAKDLKNCKEDGDSFDIYLGKTMCTYDFYEGQGRLDGAFCNYTEKDKMDFLHKISEDGVINMEMESLAFAAMCSYAGIKGMVLLFCLKKNGFRKSTRLYKYWMKVGRTNSM